VLAALYLCDVSVTPTGLNYTPTLFNSNWSELALLISDSLLSSVFNNLLALYFSSWSTLWILLITFASFNYSLLNTSVTLSIMESVAPLLALPVSVGLGIAYAEQVERKCSAESPQNDANFHPNHSLIHCK
jgi:hypothetical protein